MSLFNGPLIEPGDYNFSFNQEYLLTKFWGMDVYTAIFWAFWISVFLALGVYSFFKIAQRIKYIQNKEIYERQERLKKNILDELFQEFHEICRLIYEDTNVFRRPEKMVKQMYYPRLKEVVYLMSRNQDFMKKNYKYLIPDYEYYRKIIIKEENTDDKTL